MRINDTYRQLQGPATSGVKSSATDKADKGNGEGAAAVAGSGHESVKVTISTKARQLASTQPADFDAAKVERLKAAVENGSFKVDPHAVAKGIADDVTP
jgi:flagellar biosynthesis anti-sigma factor FlgM